MNASVPFKVLLAAADALDVAYELACTNANKEYRQILDARNDLRIYVRIILSDMPPVEVSNAPIPKFIKQGANV